MTFVLLRVSVVFDNLALMREDYPRSFRLYSRNLGFGYFIHFNITAKARDWSSNCIRNVMNTKANIDESVKDRFKAFADVIHEQGDYLCLVSYCPTCFL